MKESDDDHDKMLEKLAVQKSRDTKKTDKIVDDTSQTKQRSSSPIVGREDHEITAAKTDNNEPTATQSQVE